MQRRPIRMEANPVQRSFKAGREKVVIFENTEHREIQSHAANQEALAQSGFFGLTDFLGQPEISSRGGKEQPGKPPIPPPVKYIARHQKNEILTPERAQVIERKKDGAKEKKRD